MVNTVVIKVCGCNVHRHIVGRMLDGGKGINLFSHRQHHDTTRMLSRSTTHPDTSKYDPVNFTVSLMYAALFIINKSPVIVPDDIGDDLPFTPRKPNDLGGHDDIVGALGEILHAYVFAAVMQDGAKPQQKPLPILEAVDPLHAVKNLQRDELQRFGAFLASSVAL